MTYVKCQRYCFADDTICFSSGDELKVLTENIVNEMVKLVENKLSLNY